MFLLSGLIDRVFEDKIVPLRQMVPYFNFSRPAIVLRIVVLPAPDGPSKHTIFPFFGIAKFIFFIS